MSNAMMTLLEFYETHQKMGANEVILDVRNPDEFAQGHIAGAVNIPVSEVAERSQELKKFNRIYIHCKRGGRAKTAYEALKEQGFQNLVCIGDAGMDLWVEKGYPVDQA